MTFKRAHFGEGYLDSSSMTFTADRLFSALYLEALKHGKEDEFFKLAETPDFRISDAFPYKNKLFLPKPIGYPRNSEVIEDIVELRRKLKKQKKLKFIKWSDFDKFLSGEDVECVSFGVPDMRTHKNHFDDQSLFQSEAFVYDGVSLYFIGVKSLLLEELMTSLQYTGIGGKRSSGFGQFKLEILVLESSIVDRLTTVAQSDVMLIASSIPLEHEEIEFSLKNSAYLLRKFSGFAYSTTLKETYRKKDVYKFLSGSTFTSTFNGEIIDVKPDKLSHNVYHYAKPLFIKIRG